MLVPAVLKCRTLMVWAVLALPGQKTDAFRDLPLLATIPAPSPAAPSPLTPVSAPM